MLMSAGIGITPMAGMLSQLAKAGSKLPVTLLHADHVDSVVQQGGYHSIGMAAAVHRGDRRAAGA
jgi:hypothetical protein